MRTGSPGWILLAVIAGVSSQETIRFFQISDLHLDRNYSRTGLESDYCHDVAKRNGSLGPAGMYACDPPSLLVESALAYMKKVNAKPDFILWTGDSNPHWPKPEKGPQGPDFDYIFNNLKKIIKLLSNTFPDVPVIPALGNHDTAPPDQYPDFKKDSDGTKKFYEKYVDKAAFGDMLVNVSRETFKKCGYYTKTFKKIKFVVLNTNLYYGNNMPLDETDPCDQIKWMKDEISKTQEDEGVFIVAHIPPGFFGRNPLKPMFNIKIGEEIAREFTDIFRDKSLASKIAYHFYGHTHTDAFRLYMTNETSETAVGVGFINPSVTPGMYLNRSSYGVNPGIREYTYDLQQHLMLDYTQHYLNLSATMDLKEEVKTRTNDKKLDEKHLIFGLNDGHNRAPPFGGVGRRKRDAEDDTTTVANTEKPKGSEETTTAAANTEKPKESEETTSVPNTEKPKESEDTTTSAANTEKTKESEETTSVPNTKKPKESEDTTTVSNNEEPEASDTETTTEPQEKAPSKNKSSTSLLDQVTNLWRVSYKATEAFQEKDLSFKSMHKAWLDMHYEKESSVFKNYYIHSTNRHILPNYTDFSDRTHAEMMCAIVEFTRESMDNCLKSRGFVFDATETNNEKDTTSVPESNTLRGFAISFSIFILIVVAVGGLYLFRKMQRNRYRAQEFLLTDSVFRYDGYSQVEDP